MMRKGWLGWRPTLFSKRSMLWCAGVIPDLAFLVYGDRRDLVMKSVVGACERTLMRIAKKN
jgi:hypothetical protein